MTTPLICFLGGWFIARLPLQPSISAYWHTNVQDVFVGIMFGVGFFLATYHGYELLDDLVSWTVAFCGFALALFPCDMTRLPETPVGFFLLLPEVSGVLHLVFAALFFLFLGINSFFIFTMTDPGQEKSANKIIRDRIYRGCGIVIFAGLAGIGVVNLAMPPEALEKTWWMFGFETMLLEAFGVSWFVKGETLFRDPEVPGEASAGGIVAD